MLNSSSHQLDILYAWKKCIFFCRTPFFSYTVNHKFWLGMRTTRKKSSIRSSGFLFISLYFLLSFSSCMFFFGRVESWMIYWANHCSPIPSCIDFVRQMSLYFMFYFVAQELDWMLCFKFSLICGQGGHWAKNMHEEKVKLDRWKRLVFIHHLHLWFRHPNNNNYSQQFWGPSFSLCWSIPSSSSALLTRLLWQL